MIPLEWYTAFFTMDTTLLEKVARTVVVYLGIAILIRVAGKRLMAQMNSLDLVVVLLLSNVVQNAIIGPDNSVLGGLVGAVVLVGADWALGLLTQHNALARRILEGSPTRVIADGRVDRGALTRLGISDTELVLALRRLGSDDPAEVSEATLEPGGDIVIRLKPGERSATRDELAAAVAELKALIAAR